MGVGRNGVLAGELGPHPSRDVDTADVGVSRGAEEKRASAHIDLKDGRFGREETNGIAHLVAGLALAHERDEHRLDRGAAMLDDLYAYFRKRG
jgi:hypothetical protein